MWGGFERSGARLVCLALAVSAWALIGCADERGQAVLLTFDPPEMNHRIDRIEVSLVSSCFSANVLGASPGITFGRTELLRGSEHLGLGKVEPGEYGLYARGVGPCVAVAGCTPVEVSSGSEDELAVVLQEIALSAYDPTLEDNGGCGNEATCREDNGAAVCDCPHDLVFDGGACTLPANTEESYLSDWHLLSERNAWGPVERDRSNGGENYGDGSAMRLRGVTYQQGIGVSAPSDVRVRLDQRCSRFRALVGIDDSVSGSSRAEVWLDGRRAYQTNDLSDSDPPQAIDLDVRGADELRLVTIRFGDPLSSHVDWALARVVCEEGWRGAALTSYASEWEWSSESNGLGSSERDGSNGEAGAEDGATMRLNGTTYTRGIGVHAPSVIELDLAGHCRRFFSNVGIDDEVRAGGSAVFQVWADDALLFESNTMTAESETETASVDLVGHSKLRLVVNDGGDGMRGDHADWAGARLLCASGWRGKPVDTYVSDWYLDVTQNGQGPVERDAANGAEPSHDGALLKIAGRTYERGLGAHARSLIRLNLDEQCTRFHAEVGLDDIDSQEGDVVFRVRADNDVLFQSGVKLKGYGPDIIDVDVTGRSTLVLEMDELADNTWYDRGDWADARLRCAPGALGLP